MAVLLRVGNPPGENLLLIHKRICGQIIDWQAKRYGISEELWVVAWKVEGSYWKEEINGMKVVVVLIILQGAKDLQHHLLFHSGVLKSYTVHLV